METIYLVINTLEEDRCILDICTSIDVANKLADIYKHNFVTECDFKEDEVDFIEIHPINLRDDVDILWDIFPEDIPRGFTYVEE